MNLIEKFENMPFQDVGTFNSIFNQSPLIGYDFSLEVEIGDISFDNKRKVKVGNDVLFLDLTQKSVKEIKKIKKVSSKRKLRRSEKTIKILPEIFTSLTSTQFLIYSAIKEAGEFDGVEELSRTLKITNKTIILNLKKLISLGYVKKELVVCNSGSYNKLMFNHNS